MVLITEGFANCPEDQIKDIEALQLILGSKVVVDRAHPPTNKVSGP